MKTKCGVCNALKGEEWVRSKSWTPEDLCEKHAICGKCGIKREDLTEPPYRAVYDTFRCRPCVSREKAALAESLKKRRFFRDDIEFCHEDTEPADRWQPIETAPRDEKLDILAVDKNGFCYVGRMFKFPSPEYGWQFVVSARTIEVTHWQPLPPPPEEKTE